MPRPNLLFVCADQFRWDCLGANRPGAPRTPNLDALAREGAAFDRAFTAIALCCPSRQAMLCGIRPEQYGALWNFDMIPCAASLTPERATWSQALQDQGYRSAFVGKWHVSPTLTPLAFGYERYMPEEAYAEYLQEKGLRPEFTNGFFGEKNPLPLEDSGTHFLAQSAIDCIEEYARDGAPWHIRLDFPEPHLPCRPSEPYASMYDPASIPPWGGFGDSFENKPYIQRQMLVNWKTEALDWAAWSRTVALYYGQISQLDDAIGRVLAALENSGQRDNTLVVFTADHGDMCASHGMLDKHYVMYEDIMRIPLLLRWPEGIAAGQRHTELVSGTLDIMPTLLALFGIEAPEGLHGESLVPLLRGEAPQTWRETVVSTYNGHHCGLFTQRMARGARYKYIWNATDIDELYDLESDPYELVNRIQDPALGEILAQLRLALFQELRRCNDPWFRADWLHDQLLHGRKIV